MSGYRLYVIYYVWLDFQNKASHIATRTVVYVVKQSQFDEWLKKILGKVQENIVLWVKPTTFTFVT